MMWRGSLNLELITYQTFKSQGIATKKVAGRQKWKLLKKIINKYIGVLLKKKNKNNPITNNQTPPNHTDFLNLGSLEEIWEYLSQW